MLNVVPVVEEQPVIEPAVVAGRSSRVLEMPLKETQAETGKMAGDEEAGEERGGAEGKDDPGGRHNSGLGDGLSCPLNGSCVAAVMTQVPLPPQCLGETHERAEIHRIQAIQRARSEERP